MTHVLDRRFRLLPFYFTTIVYASPKLPALTSSLVAWVLWYVPIFMGSLDEFFFFVIQVTELATRKLFAKISAETGHREPECWK